MIYGESNSSFNVLTRLSKVRGEPERCLKAAAALRNALESYQNFQVELAFMGMSYRLAYFKPQSKRGGIFEKGDRDLPLPSIS